MTDLAALHAATQELAQAMAAFRLENDRRLAEIETKGRLDPLTQDKVERLNTEVGRLNETVQAIETTLARPGAARAPRPAMPRRPLMPRPSPPSCARASITNCRAWSARP
ncbi:hypothetical protein D3874_01725 [Oleomonas cavernae]|uniref:Uncharacterized protein n=1 Tax=Oleomonas cavernae TaxID=2320859 RepID=A0A418WTI4_9PROT|nr:hypothetical protein [Oleomonas cavernae]RJF94581.1 hypothetical protein D3874_01725 [Oleomonas cavernae]